MLKKMDIKLFDSELKVMDVLWKEGDKTAKYISDVLKDETGWNMNTTYTIGLNQCRQSASIKISLAAESNLLMWIYSWAKT